MAAAFLILLLASPDGHAQLIIPGNTTATFLGTIPENPVAGEPYLVRASFGPCEAISVAPNDATIINPVGSSFTIQVPGVFSGNCSVTIRETAYSLSPIAQPGVYTVTLQMIDAGVVGRLGTRLVTVVAPGSGQGGAAALMIPASGPVSSALLAFCVLALTALHRRL